MRNVIVAALFCALVGHLSAADRIRINVRQSDAAIRRQLLQLTPIGTSAERVFDVLEYRLERDRRSHITGFPGQRPGSFMSVDLGHYFEPRSFSEGFFLFPTVVQAFWHFDERNKLRDIRVRRGISGW
jgi:hypothetical protein